jgi:tetratricopeptide (TPR) repeat protein
MGVTLYEMVTGRWPFGEPDTPMGVMTDLIRNEKQTNPRDLRDDVPDWLCEVIETALNKKPGDRFATAEAMLAALNRREQKVDLFKKDAAEVQDMLRTGETGPKVEEAVRRLVERYPSNALSFHYLGQYYNRCQLRREAEEAFQKGLALDSENALLHWDLGLVLQGMGRRQEAIRHVEIALAKNLDASLRQHAETLLKALRAGEPGAQRNQGAPVEADEYEKDMAKARELMHAEVMDDTLGAELRRLVQKYPKYPYAYLHMGEYLNRCQRYREAVEAFQKGIELDDRNALLHWDLALAYQRMGRKTDAVRHLEKALSLNLDPGLRQHAGILLKSLRPKTL